METVVSINLGGSAYQIETSAHAALKAYLERAEAALASNPDKAEILKDLEQAVADKAVAFLSAYKNVITAADMAQILEQLGPVHGANAEAPSRDAPQTEEKDSGGDFWRGRRLYRIRDRGSLTGISSGLAAYLDIDPSLVRFGWIIAFFLSGGFAAVIYLVAMFVVPLASSPEDVAAAHGAPFNAQDVIERARRNFEEYATQGDRSWRTWRAEARRARRDARRAEARAFAASAPPPAGPLSWIGRSFGAIFAIVFALIGVALLIAFLFMLFSLITAGAVLGWTPPGGVPIWVAILIVCAIYGAIAGPIHAMQGVAYNALLGRPSHHAGDHSSGFGLLIFALIGWWFYEHNPDFHAWADMVWRQLEHVGRTVTNAF